MAEHQSYYQSFLEELKASRQFEGDIQQFWPELAKTLSKMPGARSARLLIQIEDSWRIIGVAPQGAGSVKGLTKEVLDRLAAEAQENDYAEFDLEGDARGKVLFCSLKGEGDSPDAYAEILIEDTEELKFFDLRTTFLLISEIPVLFMERLRKVQAERQLRDYSRALEVLSTVNARRKFIPAAMALVNDLATRYESSRVFLGWVENYYVKAHAMSGTDQFERKVEVMQRLEAAMEEARDQEEEIVFPGSEGPESITRAHEAYAQDAHIASVVSIPLRVDGEVIGVITLERENGSFTNEEIIGLRIIADQTAPVLDELKSKDRWFGKKIADKCREYFSEFLGPRHTWIKVGAIVFSLFFLFAVFFPYTYRVKANFSVVPDSLALLPVPFDGYIDEVLYKPGDFVETGQVLVTMDDGELLVEEVRALADLRRYTAEAERAEAEGDMGGFRVASELAGQAQARLELARYRLNRAAIRAPFAGILVEGDLSERLGSPVTQGEVLIKFSRLDGLFLDIELPERDIDLLDDSEKGQVAFASRPDLKFPIEIEKIEPSAVAGEGDNYFVIRAELTNEEVDWLRPGMTGVAKLNAGKRTLAWRGTHRLVDFLRMFFWI